MLPVHSKQKFVSSLQSQTAVSAIQFTILNMELVVVLRSV